MKKTGAIFLLLVNAANAQIECTETEGGWEGAGPVIEEQHVAEATILAAAQANLGVTYAVTKTLTAVCVDTSAPAPLSFTPVSVVDHTQGGNGSGWFGVYIGSVVGGVVKVCLQDHSMTADYDPCWEWDGTQLVPSGILSQPTGHHGLFTIDGAICTGGNRGDHDALDRCHDTDPSIPIIPNNKWNSNYRTMAAGDYDGDGFEEVLLRNGEVRKGPDWTSVLLTVTGYPLAIFPGDVLTSDDLPMTLYLGGGSGESGFRQHRGGIACGQFVGGPARDCFWYDDVPNPPWYGGGIPTLYDGDLGQIVAHTGLPLDSGANVVYTELKTLSNAIIDPTNGGVYQSDGNGNFTLRFSWTPSDRMPKVDVGDLNGDGKQDICWTPGRYEYNTVYCAIQD